MNSGSDFFDFFWRSSLPGRAGLDFARSISVAAIVIAGLLVLIFIAERVLFALAAYHDALGKGNPDAAVWGLLIGFLGLIPGIIYVCVRTSGKRMAACPKCGFLHYASDFSCPNCGEPNPAAVQPENPEAARFAARAKNELVAAVVVIGAGFLVVMAGILFLVAGAFSFAGSARYVY